MVALREIDILPPPKMSWKGVIASLPTERQEELLSRLRDEELQVAYGDWWLSARREQLAPPGDWFLWVMLAGRGFGKDLDDETPIPTPDGWTTMGELKVGDKVFDEQGRPCNVTAKFVPGRTRTYKVTFSDGSYLIAGADHQWVTWTHRDRKQYSRNTPHFDFPQDWPTFKGPLLDCWGNVTGYYGPKVRTTEEILTTLRIGSRRDKNHCIPVAGALQLEDKPLPIDPWLLGYWLGNGTSCNGTICSGSWNGVFDDTFVEERIKQLGYRYNKRHVVDQSHHIFTLDGFAKELVENKLLGNKHVPEAYLRASARQRKDLLRGLMDSDGYCGENNHVEFCSIDYKLAAAFQELVLSLGERCTLSDGEATLDGEFISMKYRVTWRPSRFVPFYSPRKADRLAAPEAQAMRLRHRMIENVTPVPWRPTSCITVDSPNRMYLAGKAMIPTHNTYAGSHWLIDRHLGAGTKLSAIVAATAGDLRKYCVMGPSGVMSLAPKHFYPEYKPSKNMLVWPDGGETHLYTSEKPHRLRGGNYECAWCDEVSYWKYIDLTWDNLMLTLRHGRDTRCMVTMTPRPIKAVKNMLLREGIDAVITRGATMDNKENLAPRFINEIIQRYKGTRLERQEIYGEYLEDIEGALWNYDMLDALRVGDGYEHPAPEGYRRIAVGVDPATSSATGSNETGIVGCGRGFDDHGYVLADASGVYSPEQWASAAIKMYYALNANIIVAEKNQGGEMVEHTIKSVDPTVPVKLVHASRGKVARAEPICAMYEQGRWHHVGAFPALEDEQCAFVPGELVDSPNHVDAMVWSGYELFLAENKKKRGGACRGTRSRRFAEDHAAAA